MRAGLTEDRVMVLRLAFLLFIETVIILDAAVGQIAAERFNGQPVLFRDTAIKLAEQLKMASDLSNWFNEVAVRVGTAQIDLETLRDNLQSEIDRRISIWVHLAQSRPHRSTKGPRTKKMYISSYGSSYHGAITNSSSLHEKRLA